MNVRLPQVLVLGLVLVTFPAGCTSRAQKVVATVGPRSITLGEFEDIAAKVDTSYYGADPDSTVRRRLLEDLVNKDLLALEAQHRHVEADSASAAQIKTVTNNVLMDELYKEEVSDKVKVPESEIKKRYGLMQQVLVVKHILVPTEADAKDILAQLQKGASFDSLARTRSIDTQTGKDGGLLPGFVAGDMVPEFETAAYALQKPGDTSGIVHSQFGYHIIRLVERKKPDEKPKSLADMHVQIEGQLAGAQRNDLLKQFIDHTRAAYHVQMADGAVPKVDEVLSRVRRAEGDTAVANGLIKKKVGLAFPQTSIASQAESSFVIARFDPGKTFTLGEALITMRGEPAFMRPSPGDTAKVRDFVDSEVLRRILEQEAAKRRLADKPDVKKQIDSKVEEVLVTNLYAQEVQLKAQATDEEAKAFYTAHPEYFQAKQRVNIYRISSDTKQRADSLYAVIQKGKSIEKIGKELGENQFGSVGPTGMQQLPDDPNHILTRAYGMDVGQVSPPFNFADQWIVFKVLDKKPAGLIPFESVNRDAKRGATVEKQEARLTALLTELKQKYPVAVHEDVLAEVHLPPRPTAGSAQAAGAKSGGAK